MLKGMKHAAAGLQRVEEGATTDTETVALLRFCIESCMGRSWLKIIRMTRIMMKCNTGEMTLA